LIDNAIKFTHSGRIDITIKEVDKTKESSKIEFSVKDTGIGIEKDKLEKIFDNFTQADSSTTKRYGGTGLGLSISKRLCEMMDGELTVESELGKGSCFVFRVPFKLVENALIKEKESQTPSLSQKKYNILITEDDEVNMEVLSHYVSKSGNRPVKALNGQKALDLYCDQGKDLDLILMDINMPESDGFEVTKKIRECEKKKDLKKVPIIALTANIMPGIKKRCIDGGMDDYLSKPLSYGDFLEMLSEYLKD